MKPREPREIPLSADDLRRIREFPNVEQGIPAPLPVIRAEIELALKTPHCRADAEYMAFLLEELFHGRVTP